MLNSHSTQNMEISDFRKSDPCANGNAAGNSNATAGRPAPPAPREHIRATRQPGQSRGSCCTRHGEVASWHETGVGLRSHGTRRPTDDGMKPSSRHSNRPPSHPLGGQGRQKNVALCRENGGGILPGRPQNKPLPLIQGRSARDHLLCL